MNLNQYIERQSQIHMDRVQLMEKKISFMNK